MPNKLSLLLVLGLTASSTLTAGYTAEQVKKAQTGTAIASSIALPLAILLEPKVSKPGIAIFHHVGECMARATESNHPLQNIANVALVAGASGKHAYTRSKIYAPMKSIVFPFVLLGNDADSAAAVQEHATTIDEILKEFDSLIVSRLASDIITAAVNEAASALCLHLTQQCKNGIHRRITRAATLALSETAFSTLIGIIFKGLPTQSSTKFNELMDGFKKGFTDIPRGVIDAKIISTLNEVISDFRHVMINYAKKNAGKEGFEDIPAEILKTDFDALVKDILKTLAFNALKQAVYEVIGELIQRSADDAHAVEWLEQEKTKMGVGAEATSK